jgi:hypothetical protein
VVFQLLHQTRLERALLVLELPKNGDERRFHGSKSCAGTQRHAGQPPESLET